MSLIESVTAPHLWCPKTISTAGDPMFAIAYSNEPRPPGLRISRHPAHEQIADGLIEDVFRWNARVRASEHHGEWALPVGNVATPLGEGLRCREAATDELRVAGHQPGEGLIRRD